MREKTSSPLSFAFCFYPCSDGHPSIKLAGESRLLLDRGNTGELLALQQLQASPSSGGDVGHLVPKACLLNGRHLLQSYVVERGDGDEENCGILLEGM